MLCCSPVPRDRGSEKSSRLYARMTRTPSRQQFAVTLPRFFVVIEDAWIATVAAAVAGIGFNRRGWPRVVAKIFIVGNGCVVVHGQTKLDIVNMVARYR
jgi:hypothetical protein